MALKLFVHDTTSGTCELAGLVPYPKVTTTDPAVTVTPVVDTVTGQVDYQIDVDNTVDINVENFVYDAATESIVLTETDGTVHTIPAANFIKVTTSIVTQLVKGNLIATHDDGEGNVTEIHETVTTLGASNDTIVYVNELGEKSGIAICELLSALPDNGTVVGG